MTDRKPFCTDHPWGMRSGTPFPIHSWYVFCALLHLQITRKIFCDLRGLLQNTTTVSRCRQLMVLRLPPLPELPTDGLGRALYHFSTGSGVPVSISTKEPWFKARNAKWNFRLNCGLQLLQKHGIDPWFWLKTPQRPPLVYYFFAHGLPCSYLLYLACHFALIVGLYYFGHSKNAPLPSIKFLDYK